MKNKKIIRLFIYQSKFILHKVVIAYFYFFYEYLVPTRNYFFISHSVFCTVGLILVNVKRRIFNSTHIQREQIHYFGKSNIYNFSSNPKKCL